MHELVLIAQNMSLLDEKKPQVLAELSKIGQNTFPAEAIPALFAFLESNDNDVIDAAIGALEVLESEVPPLDGNLLNRGLASEDYGIQRLVLRQMERMDNLPANVSILSLIPRASASILGPVFAKHPELLHRPHAELEEILKDPISALAFLDLLPYAPVAEAWLDSCLEHLNKSDFLVYSAMVETLTTILTPEILKNLEKHGVVDRLLMDFTQASQHQLPALFHFFTRMAIVDTPQFEKLNDRHQIVQMCTSHFDDAPTPVLAMLCDLATLNGGAKFVEPCLSEFVNRFSSVSGTLKFEYLTTLDAFLQSNYIRLLLETYIDVNKILPSIYIPDAKLIALRVLIHATQSPELCSRMFSTRGFIDAITRRDEQDLEARQLRHDLVCSLLDKGNVGGNVGATLLKYKLDGVNPSEPTLLFAPS
jgi:hypothetical protein